MGRYGLTKISFQELAKEEQDNVIVETTKVINSKQDARKVAIAFWDRAWVQAQRDEYNKAISDCTSAIQIAPEFASAYYNRGCSYWATEEFDKALDDFNKALLFYSENSGTPQDIEDTKRCIETLEEYLS